MSTTFADLGVPADLAAVLAERGITAPFPIQAAAIADGLAGRDICGRAPTGSGKTLAFGIPLVARCGQAKPRRPRVLVLAPTRELAEQIYRDLDPLAEARDLTVLAAYGGVGLVPQIKRLRRGVDILIGCPGRLGDLIRQGALELGDVRQVVVDEADRMSDMGFLPEVRRLLDQTSPDRQTILFSATLDGDVAQLKRHYQNDPVTHDVAGVELDEGEVIEHLFWEVRTEERAIQAARLIAQAGPTMVFVRTRHGADRLQKALHREGVRSEAIHGGRSQAQRTKALASFTAGRVRALVATDVVARGIHVDDVSCVLHFDPPEDAKTYLHRSGRTARAGAGGTAVSFVARAQYKDVRAMARHAGIDMELAPPGTSDDALRELAATAPLPAPPAERRERSDDRGSDHRRPNSTTRERHPRQGARPGSRSDSSRSDRPTRGDRSTRSARDDRPTRDDRGAGQGGERRDDRRGGTTGERRDDRRGGTTGERRDDRGEAPRSGGPRPGGARSNGPKVARSARPGRPGHGGSGGFQPRKGSSSGPRRTTGSRRP